MSEAETKPTEQDVVLARLREMEQEARGLDTKKCIEGEAMLWHPFERALIPGHIYSDNGLAEAKISGCCEYHFDRMFDEQWVDAITGEPGLMNEARAQWLQEREEQLRG